MKRINSLPTVIIIFALILSSCGSVSKMVNNASNVKYTVTPSPLEMRGGKVEVKISVQYPEKFFNKKAIVTLKPVLQYEGGSAELPTKSLQGESVEANNEVIKYDVGGTVEYSATIDYVPGMLSSKLMMSAVITMKGKDNTLPAVEIAQGVLSSADLVQKESKAIAQKDNFQRVTAESYMADIHYMIQNWNVNPKELQQEDMKKLDEYLSKIKSDARVALKNVAIDAYASPDGAIELNEKVSKGRKGSASSVLTQKTKKAGVKIDDANYTEKAVTEDWDGFKAAVEASSIQDKELILRVLSMYADPVVREKELKNMAATFDVLAKDILPKLRRSEFTLNIEVMGRSDEEILAAVESNIEVLSIEEMLYAASMVSDLEKRLTIYQKAAEKYPSDYRAKNNVGYVLYQQGNIDAAEEAFKASKELNDNDIVNNNLGAVAFKKGNLAQAEELFTASLGAGEVANHNLGTIKIIKGEYEAAVNYFGSSCSANAGLARLLQGNNDEALKSLECIENPEAIVYYIKAIVGARTQNESLLLNNLRLAVGKDASLKERAKKDLEFRNYFINGTFKSIIE